MFENGWWGDASLDPPLPKRITMSLTTTPTSQFCFSMMWGKFCHSCFEITASTALAQFGHFTLKTRVRFQKGGGGLSPGCATDLMLFWVSIAKQNHIHSTCNFSRRHGSVSTKIVITPIYNIYKKTK